MCVPCASGCCCCASIKSVVQADTAVAQAWLSCCTLSCQSWQIVLAQIFCARPQIIQHLQQKWRALSADLCRIWVLASRVGEGESLLQQQLIVPLWTASRRNAEDSNQERAAWLQSLHFFINTLCVYAEKPLLLPSVMTSVAFISWQLLLPSYLLPKSFACIYVRGVLCAARMPSYYSYSYMLKYYYSFSTSHCLAGVLKLAQFMQLWSSVIMECSQHSHW